MEASYGRVFLKITSQFLPPSISAAPMRKWITHEMMFDKIVPFVVADDEIILRSVDSRHFYRDGRKRPNIFKPPFGKAEVSVMRFQYMPIEECKMRGKEVVFGIKHEFKGFAALKCATIREAKAEVQDSRKIYLCHADIIYSNPRPPEAQPNRAPENPQALMEFEEVARQLVDACKTFLDPAPAGKDWQGEKITL